MMKITTKSHKAPQMLAFYVCQLTGEDMFPKVLLDKKVASRTVACRARSLNRWGFVRKAIDGEGNISWPTLGPYSITWRGEWASTVTHLPSDICIEVPPDGVFRIDAEITNPHLDTLASAKGRMVSLPLAGYFPADKGPNEHRLDAAGKTLAALGEKMAKQLQMQMLQVARGAVVEDAKLVPDTNYEKKVAALAKARVMLANSRAPFALPAAPPPPPRRRRSSTQT